MSLTTIDFSKVDKKKLIDKAYMDMNLFESFWPGIFYYDTAQFHREWDEIFTNNEINRRVCLIAPRDHAKSTHIDKYIARALAYRLEKYIMIISETTDQSELLIQDVKIMIEENPAFAKLYSLNITRDRLRSLEINGNMYIQAKGSGQKMRGSKYQHTRPTLIICDDIMSEEIKYSKDKREKLEKWFYGAVLHSVDARKGKVWVIGTPMHQDDLLENLYRNPSWTSRRYSATKNGRIDGEPLWDGKNTKLDIINKMKMHESQGRMDEFMTEIMCKPIGDENRKFKPKFLQFYDDESHIYRDNFTIVATDFSISKSEGSDFTAIGAVNIRPDGKFEVLEILQERLDPFEILEEIGRFVKEYNPITVGIETVAFQEVMAYLLERYQRQYDVYFDVTELKPSRASGSKRARIFGLLPIFRTGGFLFPESRPPWFYTFREQYKDYPKSKHDDMMDMLTKVVELAKQFGMYGNKYSENRNKDFKDDFNISPYSVR